MAEGVRLPHDWYPESLPANVSLGERSWLYSAYAFVHSRCRSSAGVRVGRDTGLYHGTFFELGPEASVEIGDYCSLVGAILRTDGRIVIGDYVFIAHEVVIADSFAGVPPQADAAAPPAAPRDIVIEEAAWIGANAVILSGARIGRGAIVGAGSVVDGEVPAFTVAAGNPARAVSRIKPL